jgi:hypothetical protein
LTDAAPAAELVALKQLGATGVTLFDAGCFCHFLR